MHVIAIKALRVFWETDGQKEAKDPLLKWHHVVSNSDWNSFADIKATFNSADQVGEFVVFNIGGNKYRLIVYVDYRFKKVFVRHVLTHAEYDDDDWKKDPWYSSKSKKKASPRKPPTPRGGSFKTKRRDT